MPVTPEKRPGRPYALETIIEANEGLTLAAQGNYGARKVRTTIRVALRGVKLSRSSVVRSFESGVVTVGMLRGLLRTKGLLLEEHTVPGAGRDERAALAA